MNEDLKLGIKRLIPGNVEVDIQDTVNARISVHVSHGFDEQKLRRAAGQLLIAMGLHGKEENFRETPARITKMWKTWLEPRVLDLPVFSADASGMVVLRSHSSVTVCPHHLLPVELIAHIGYVPQSYAVGISKLARLIDLAAGSFMLQEHISEFVVKLLDVLLQPKGVICAIVGNHGCMRLRGVKSTGDIVTSNMSGIFFTDEKARSEFHASINRTR